MMSSFYYLSSHGDVDDNQLSVVTIVMMMTTPMTMMMLLLLHQKSAAQVRRVGAKPPVEREPYSLYVCGLKNPIRKRLIEIVEHKLFEVDTKQHDHLSSSSEQHLSRSRCLDPHHDSHPNLDHDPHLDLDHQAFILAAICGTCLCLAVFQPTPNKDTTAVNEFLVSGFWKMIYDTVVMRQIFQEEIEIIFTVIFTSECAMKIVAYGFIAHQNAYLKFVHFI